jgi:hypothetical protein
LITGESSILLPYLAGMGKGELFEDNVFFEGCGKLSVIVGEREITALLARLFVEQMVAQKENLVDDELPKNIPELMLQSIKVLNSKTPANDLTLRDVIIVAKITSWECLKKEFRPLPADYESVIEALIAVKNGEDSLKHLKEKLKLIETVSVKERIRFKIDPLSEYLAAIYLIEINKTDKKKWKEFFNQAIEKEGAPESIKGFLLALRDCCLTAENKELLPAFIVENISRIIEAEMEAIENGQIIDSNTVIIQT